MKTNDLRNKLERLKGRKIELENSIVELRGKVRKTKMQLEQLEKAREIIRTVGLMTQQELQYHISDITSLALESVFKEPYKLLLEFVERRNKTECDIVFEKDGEKFAPIDSAGGGVVDVASFALRIASWSMAIANKSHVIILDEPMRFVSAEYQENASEMIKEISQKLKIQFIIVTHNSTLASYADKTFEVSIKKGISKVKES
jgi:DNA repair exonuclease SbcCD ATPase subunit